MVRAQGERHLIQAPLSTDEDESGKGNDFADSSNVTARNNLLVRSLDLQASALYPVASEGLLLLFHPGCSMSSYQAAAHARYRTL